MTNEDKREIISLIFILIYVILFGILFYNTAKDCNGRLVRGVLWFECIDDNLGDE